jgi:flagellar protein FlaJ
MDEREIKLIVLIVSLVLIISGYFSRDVGIFANLLIISTFISFSTFAFFEYKHYREWKEMEEKLPLFLHDLTEALASGLSLPKAIKVVSKHDYGSLNKLIKPIANQISWNVPIHKVLDRFAEKMKKSKKISTTFKILKETYISGGNTIAVLTSLSESLEMLQQMEKERKSILNQYTLMIYAISFIFLGVVVMINKLLLPIFANPQLTGMGAGGIGMGIIDPCSVCSGVACNVCDSFAFIAHNFLGVNPEKPYYYVSIFFLLSLTQAIFAGFVAGQVAEGSIKAGIRHCLILTSIVVAAYLLLFRIGLIGV